MPRIVDHPRRRAEILDQCLELFAARGYGSVRIREIATATGHSVGTIYHYFVDKEDLGRQLFAHIGTQIVRDAALVFEDADDVVRFDILERFVLDWEERLTNALLIGLDHNRLFPDSRQVTAQTLVTIKDAMVEYMRLENTELETVLFSNLIGCLIRRALDPSQTSLTEELGAFRALDKLSLAA